MAVTITDDTADSEMKVPPRNYNKRPDIDEVTVMIKNAMKTYGSGPAVLRGLDMTVVKGKIYGLLGPSGCGKTTLLNIIVGKTDLDSGDIMVKADKREKIGYMPQNLNLHGYLTILQTYKFYGRLLNMDMKIILKRAKNLELLLGLPNNNRLIKTLSGGQQRRVSLGVVLLHDPDILILDEPTVGLDPILSISIWNHLLSLAEQGKTIIITTHYIEEARQAHTVGMMREGILVAEESPEVLMSRCNSTTLEEAFLKESRKQNNSSKIQVADTRNQLHSKKSKTKLNFNDGAFCKHRVYSLLYKNLWLFLQEKSFSTFLILLPLVQIILFNKAVGHDPKHLNIAVVNEELQQIENGKCMPRYYNGCFLKNPEEKIMGCAFTEKLRSKSFNIIHYDEVNTALNAVKKNHVWGLLYFPNNYTKSLAVRVKKFPKISNLHLNSSTMEVWIDNSSFKTRDKITNARNYEETVSSLCFSKYPPRTSQFTTLTIEQVLYHIIARMLKSKLVLNLEEYLGDSMSNCNISTKNAHPPISFKKPVYGSMDNANDHFASETKLCLLCYFMPILFTMGSILSEKNDGMMERMMISGVKFCEVMASMAITQMIVHAVQTGISMYVMFIHFGHPHLGSPLATITILMLVGMEGMLMGFIVGAMSSDHIAAGSFASGINFGCSLSSGLIWPLEGSHYLIRTTSSLYPLNAPIKALLAITGKGFSVYSEPVIMAFVSVFCWSSVKITVIYVWTKLNKDLWTSKKL